MSRESIYFQSRRQSLSNHVVRATYFCRIWWLMQILLLCLRNVGSGMHHYWITAIHLFGLQPSPDVILGKYDFISSWLLVWANLYLFLWLTVCKIVISENNLHSADSDIHWFIFIYFLLLQKLPLNYDLQLLCFHIYIYIYLLMPTAQFILSFSHES